MAEKLKYLFVGGDLRFLYTAERLHKLMNLKDEETAVYGFNTIPDNISVPVTAAPVAAENVILPLPSVTGNKISAPHTDIEIPLSLIPKICKSTVFCGRATPEIEEMCDKSGLGLVDYFVREELTVKNAALTAEAALEVIIRESARSITGMKILITGYGRISKVLVKYLTSLGGNVTVYARKCADRAWAETMGCKSVPDLDGELNFDTIVNTVPAPIFTQKRLENINAECLVIDLASKDRDGVGGVDTEFAVSAGVKVIWALSLPGKVSPITAGEIIADTLSNIIHERGGIFL